MNINRLARYEMDIRSLDECHKIGGKRNFSVFGVSTSVSRAVKYPSEIWTHSLLQEHFLGQKSSLCRSQKAIASFGLREGVYIGSRVQLHGWKRFMSLELWLYVLAPHVFEDLSSSTWNLNTFSICPFWPSQFFPIHSLQGASFYISQSSLNDIY